VSVQWLAVQSFQHNQELLAAINKISIHLRLQLEGNEDSERAGEVNTARELLSSFFRELETLVIVTERGEARMHLGGDAARRRARLFALRPQPVLGMALGEIFQNGEAFPDEANLRLQHRHLARGRVAQDFGLRVGLPEPDAFLGEGDAAMFQCQPGPQAPGREVLVADHQRVTVRRHALAFRPKSSAPSLPPLSCCGSPAINAPLHQARVLEFHHAQQSYDA